MNDAPLVLLVGAITLFARGVTLTRRTKRSQLACSAAAFVTLACALSPWYDTWSDTHFSVHMTQHLLLILVIAPLLVMGSTGATMMRGLPLAWQRRVNRVLRATIVRRSVAWLALPAVVWITHVVIVWTWHAPDFYEGALHHETVHAGEHALFLFSAVAFWSVVRHAGTRRGVSPGAAIVYLVAASVQSSALGALLLFARRPLYSSYPSLQDQQLAGLVMWLPATVIYLAGIAFVFVRWWHRTEQRQARVAIGHVLPMGAIIVVALAFSAYHHPSSAVAQSTDPPPADAATTLYLRDCATCHGADGSGSSHGPNIQHAGAALADYMISTGRMPIAQSTDVPKRSSSPYTAIEQQELVDKVASLGSGPDRPEVGGGVVPRGGQLYRLHCASCHGITGSGGALAPGSVPNAIGHAPSLASSTSQQVGDAVRTGPGNMPSFPSTALTPQDVDDIAAYVQSLHHTDDRGGWSLGHFGPVPEGAVAVLGGLALLIAALCLIGTKST